MILKEKAARWNAHPEIKALLAEIAVRNEGWTGMASYRKEGAAALLARNFDRAGLASKGLQYERLDQLTMDILLGVE
jgi:xylose isomerase